MAAPPKIVDFLSEHNRPFTTNDIVKGLQGQFGKTKVEHALCELSEEGKVIEKNYGKQKLYCIVQDAGASGSKLRDNILEMDRESSRLETKIKDIDNVLHTNSAKLQSIQGVSSVESKKKLRLLEEEVERLEFNAHLNEEKNKNIKDKETITSIIKKYNMVSKEYSKRKRMCTDVLNTILENYPKSKKHLFEEVGVITDEDVDFNINYC